MKKVWLTSIIMLFLLGCYGTQTVDQITVINNDVPTPSPEEEKVVMLKIVGMT